MLLPLLPPEVAKAPSPTAVARGVEEEAEEAEEAVAGGAAAVAAVAAVVRE